MATSVVQICNDALQGLKRERIMALTDNSEEAAVCNQAWPSVRDAVLRTHPWNCAMRQAQLHQSATAPTWKWGYAYPLPTDCLRVWEFVGSDGNPIRKWEKQGNCLLCNEDAPVYISYVRREEDPTLYDALLCDALTARLMVKLAFPLNASVAATQQANAMYEASLREARGVDAKESGDSEPLTLSNWVSSKYGSRVVR